MGFRFQKRIRLGKGLRVNLSKSGVGFSVGRPGAWFSVNPKGKPNVSVGEPGTGLSYRTGCAGEALLILVVVLSLGWALR